MDRSWRRAKELDRGANSVEDKVQNLNLGGRQPFVRTKHLTFEQYLISVVIVK